MLKRQRASSPSPPTQATAMELSLLSLDPPSSEHGVKRRRILTPPLDGPSRGRGPSPVLSVDDVDEDDTMNDGTPRLWGSDNTGDGPRPRDGPSNGGVSILRRFTPCSDDGGSSESKESSIAVAWVGGDG